MSIKAEEIVAKVHKFIKYWHPELVRRLPPNSTADYLSIRNDCEEFCKPAPAPAKTKVKKKAKKKVAKKK